MYYSTMILMITILTQNMMLHMYELQSPGLMTTCYGTHKILEEEWGLKINIGNGIEKITVVCWNSKDHKGIDLKMNMSWNSLIAISGLEDWQVIVAMQQKESLQIENKICSKTVAFGKTSRKTKGSLKWNRKKNLKRSKNVYLRRMSKLLQLHKFLTKPVFMSNLRQSRSRY